MSLPSLSYAAACSAETWWTKPRNSTSGPSCGARCKDPGHEHVWVSSRGKGPERETRAPYLVLCNCGNALHSSNLSSRGTQGDREGTGAKDRGASYRARLLSASVGSN